MTSPPPTRTTIRRQRGFRARMALAATVTGLALPSAILHLTVICVDLRHGRSLQFVDALSLLSTLWRLAVFVQRADLGPTRGRHRAR